MKTPFIFGKLASGNDFTNRTLELKRLAGNFIAGTNTIIISPRRWGKSSLVELAAANVTADQPKIRVIFLDLFNVRSEENFFRKYAEGTIRATTTRAQEILSFLKKFFTRMVPVVSFSPDHLQEFSLSMDWREVARMPDEILELPQRIATAKGWKLIICIDEFQAIGNFKDPIGFQKLLRSQWQRQQDVSYCLYGSRKSMMMHVFGAPSMPFYKFGDIMFLDKIAPEDWVVFITSRFAETGKSITSGHAMQLAALVENHPYYVQQLAQICWLRTLREVSLEILDESLESLILQLSLLFQNLCESLTATHVRFLQALLNGEQQLTSKETVQRYDLGTSANVLRIKKALSDREIIDITGRQADILDPVFKLWLKRYYFGSNH
jgi:hypothetical protein